MKKLLTKECEKWAKEHGGTEFASDCELFNEELLRFHLRIGFKEENRIICFLSARKLKNKKRGKVL